MQILSYSYSNRILYFYPPVFLAVMAERLCVHTYFRVAIIVDIVHFYRNSATTHKRGRKSAFFLDTTMLPSKNFTPQLFSQ